jgi:hypothetical protein
VALQNNLNDSKVKHNIFISEAPWRCKPWCRSPDITWNWAAFQKFRKKVLYPVIFWVDEMEARYFFEMPGTQSTCTRLEHPKTRRTLIVLTVAVHSH